MPALTPEQIQALVAVLGALATAIGTGLVFYWRVATRVASFTAAQNATLTALDRMRVQLAGTAKRFHEQGNAFARDIAQLEKTIATLSAIMHEREKDLSRVEGQIEQLGAVVVKQVATMQGVLSSTEALWRTLHTLHPQQVPKRASERG